MGAAGVALIETVFAALVPQALLAVTLSMPVVYAVRKLAVMALVPCPLATVALAVLNDQFKVLPTTLVTE